MQKPWPKCNPQFEWEVLDIWVGFMQTEKTGQSGYENTYAQQDL